MGMWLEASYGTQQQKNIAIEMCAENQNEVDFKNKNLLGKLEGGIVFRLEYGEREVLFNGLQRFDLGPPRPPTGQTMSI